MADSCSYETDELECVKALQELHVNKPSIQAAKNSLQNFPLNCRIPTPSNVSQVSRSASSVRIINSAIFIESTNNDLAPNGLTSGSIQSRSTTYIKHNNVPESRPSASTSSFKAAKNGYGHGPLYSPVEFSKCLVRYGKDSEIGAGEVPVGVVCKESLGTLAWQKWYESKQIQENQRRDRQKEEERLKQKELQELKWERKAKAAMEKSNREAWLRRKAEEERAKKKLLEKKLQQAKQQSKRTCDMVKSRNEELYRSWLREKEKQHQEQEYLKEERLRQKQQAEIERRERNDRVFEEWLSRSTNCPKPMAPIIYDAKLPGRNPSNRKDMFWNPNAWRTD